MLRQARLGQGESSVSSLAFKVSAGSKESMILYSHRVVGMEFCINKVTRCLSGHSLAN